jgi:hypothetical protein
MNAIGYLFLFLLVASPIAWLVAEFKWSVSVRVTFGFLSLFLVALCMAGLVGVTTKFHFDIWYGENTKSLIDESVRQLEVGNTNQVLKVFKKLQNNFQPTYENRAEYNLLVSNAVTEMSHPAP